MVPSHHRLGITHSFTGRSPHFRSIIFPRKILFFKVFTSSKHDQFKKQSVEDLIQSVEDLIQSVEDLIQSVSEWKVSAYSPAL